MNRFLLAPDSYKGSVDAAEICEIWENSIKKFKPDAQVISLPIADGGEGTVDCFLTCLTGERVRVQVTGPNFEKVFADYAVIEDGKTAVIELASAAGLPMTEPKNPAATTTFGVGELIRDAVSRGCRKIILGLGGSATNDAGAGLGAALGVRFLKKDGSEFLPLGATLSDIYDIKLDAAYKLLNKTEVIAMCDIENPLFGENGAAHVFARQKGADDTMIDMLDCGLKAFADTVFRVTGMSVDSIPGSGAAGGAGAGAIVFAGAKLCRGIDTVLDTVNFEKKARGTDLVITGEGRLDGQSLGGKAILGVSKRARRLGIPVAVIAGDLGDEIEKIYDEGVSFALSTNRLAQDFSVTRHRAKQDLALTMETLMRIINTI